LTRGSPGGDKTRSDHSVERHHELVDRQVHSELSIPKLLRERAGCIENDVDLAHPLRDAADVLRSWLAYGEMQMIWLLLRASLALAGLVIGTVSLVLHSINTMTY
jgi:hypothetical protein